MNWGLSIAVHTAQLGDGNDGVCGCEIRLTFIARSA